MDCGWKQLLGIRYILVDYFMTLWLRSKGLPDLLHSLSRLSSRVDQVEQLELSFLHVQVLVERRALAPLRHNGQLGFADAAHEEQNVDVSAKKTSYSPIITKKHTEPRKKSVNQ